MLLIKHFWMGSFAIFKAGDANYKNPESRKEFLATGLTSFGYTDGYRRARPRRTPWGAGCGGLPGSNISIKPNISTVVTARLRPHNLPHHKPAEPSEF